MPQLGLSVYSTLVLKRWRYRAQVSTGTGLGPREAVGTCVAAAIAGDRRADVRCFVGADGACRVRKQWPFGQRVGFVVTADGSLSPVAGSPFAAGSSANDVALTPDAATSM